MTKTKIAKKIDLRKLPKAKRPEPTTGQSGPKLTLFWTQLTADEQHVVKKLAEAGKPLRTSEIAGKGKLSDNSNLRVRNALRRVTRAGMVKSTARGVYAATHVGVATNDNRDVKPVTPIKAAKAIKAVKVKAAKKAGNYPENLIEKVVAAGIDPASANYKSAIVVAAGFAHGFSDTKIAKATGISRGYLIPRVKALKAMSPGDLDPRALAALATKIENGVSA